VLAEAMMHTPAHAGGGARAQRRTVADRAPQEGVEGGLFERLRARRKALADQRGVPAYVVFNDRTLQEMAALRPRTREELLAVHGVGQRKLAEYGDAFLAEIRGVDGAA
jgi:ATP-dependent DNA helicase RecQ